MGELQELRLIVPTYNARFFAKEVERDEKPEFGDPQVKVLIREADGVRIVLGAHDYDDFDKPEIQVERQPNGWAIFMHPVGGGDPCGYVYFLDDGRSFLVKEIYARPPITVIEEAERVPELDGPLEDEETSDKLLASECLEEEGFPKPDSVIIPAEEKLSVRSVDDALLVDEAYEFASELRSLVYWEEATETWKSDMALGADSIAAIKRLLEHYNLAPFPKTHAAEERR